MPRYSRSIASPKWTWKKANAEQARIEIMLEDALDELWLEIVDQSGSVIAMVPAA